MKNIRILAVCLAAFASVLTAFSDEAAKPTWVCTLKVDNPKQQSKVVKDTDTASRSSRSNRSNRNRTAVKSMARSIVLPVKVSVSGKDAPTSGFTIKSTFVGTHDGKKTIIGETTTPVNLENGAFKTEIKSPQVTLTKTMTTRHRHTESTTEGDRITGTIVQLVYEGQVVRSWASRSDWTKLAKESTLDTKALLK